MWHRTPVKSALPSGRPEPTPCRRLWIWLARSDHRSDIMLDGNLKAQLKGYLERISQPVELIASVDDGSESRGMLELLRDIQSVSDLISIDVRRRAKEGLSSASPRRTSIEIKSDTD